MIDCPERAIAMIRCCGWSSRAVARDAARTAGHDHCGQPGL